MTPPSDLIDRPVLTFGDDGSPEADVAWLWIASQRWPGWRVEIVHARPALAGPPLPPERTAPHVWTPPAPRPVFAETGFEGAEHLLAETDPRLALTRETDLLVVGPRGAGFLKALHLGSTTEWLLVHPPSPMVIARHGHAVRKIVVAVDGSSHAQRAIDRLVTLPWMDRAELVVAVVEDDRVVDAPSVAAAVAGQLEPVCQQVRTRVLAGRPTHELLALVEDEQADLIALGTRGLTGLHRLRLGSTAGAVARAAPCSVLLACDEG